MKFRFLHLAAFLSLFACLLTANVSYASKTGYNWGFFVSDDEENFKLVWTGGILPHFIYQKRRSPPVGSNPQYGTFVVYAYTTIRADIMKRGKAELTLAHGTGAPSYANVSIGNAIVEYRFHPAFAITCGTVGLSLDFGADYGWLLLNDPPITRTQGDGVNDGVPTGRVTPLRSSFGAPGGMGLRFSGYAYKFYYAASVINGNESAFDMNPDKRFSFGGRLRFDALGHESMEKETDYDYSESPKLSFNIGSIYQGKRIDPNTNADVKYWWTSSLGAGLRYKGFAITTEGYHRRTRFFDIGNATWARPLLTDIGYYVALGYYVLPKKLELAAVGGQIFRQGPDNNSHEVGGGINWYIFGFNTKVQLSYTWREDFDDITGLENNHIHTVNLHLAARF